MTVWTAGAASGGSGATLVVGHRGGRGEGWPAENTMAAFERARAEGARAIELDVRTCSGGEVVVFHDESLERMTAGRDARAVASVSLGELGRVDLAGGARAPSLAEVLAWAHAHGVAVNVEMKHEVPSRPALARETVRQVSASGADVLLSSFDPLLLVLAAAFDHAVPRALLTHERQTRAADLLERSVRPPLVQALHLERTQAGRRVTRYLRKGLRLGAWTVNDLPEGARLAALGVASIITDRPGAMIAELTRTGHFRPA